MFQSTHPHGVRRYAIKLCCRVHDVSIHAPARGATVIDVNYNLTLTSFNPRTRTGCDMLMTYPLMMYHEFQSTHPHGVRPAKLSIVTYAIASFNPRTRTGCDGYELPTNILMISFNPRTRTGCD